jgi:F420-dependent oxidoreductase-like protein
LRSSALEALASVIVSIRLGYQIPNFTYGTGVAELFPTVVAQAREAEGAGFDTVFVMDHLYQLPGLGSPDQPMLECYSTLAALAASTSTVQLSSLVTGNTYRNPALLAKTVTTLDVISRGRAVLGIGAGWFELEHRQLGFEFGTFTDRFERLDEALQIIDPMLRGQRPSLEGKWYRAETAMNEPRFRDDLPIMLGGGGEKKTFGLAARYAQHLNIICPDVELPRKLAALDERCAEAGRDRSSIETSTYALLVVDEDGDRARTLQRDFLRGTGVDLDALDDEQRAAATSRMFVGTPDDVAADLQTRLLDSGVDGLTVSMPANGHVPGAVTLAGQTLTKLLAR